MHRIEIKHYHEDMREEFESFRIGRLFHFNGNDYVKQSTRTARMLNNGRIFYFGKKEIIYPIAY